MDAHDVLRDMIHQYGVNYGGALDEREAAALRAALTPWICWMVRPPFNPLRDDQMLDQSEIRDGWTTEDGYLVPPTSFSGEFPEWAYGLTQRHGTWIRWGGMVFWRSTDGVYHARSA